MKRASSFGQANNGRANSVGEGASSSGAPHERGGVAQRAETPAAANKKELMHILESTLITWTKLIKNVLKQVSYCQLSFQSLPLHDTFVYVEFHESHAPQCKRVKRLTFVP